MECQKKKEKAAPGNAAIIRLKWSGFFGRQSMPAFRKAAYGVMTIKNFQKYLILFKIEHTNSYVLY